MHRPFYRRIWPQATAFALNATEASPGVVN
jgi:hypothetical protein